MPLNSAYRLRLSQLGHIAGGINSGRVALGADCRGSSGTRTSMWADFRIGSISFNQVSRLQGNDPIDDGFLILSVPSSGGVGAYMGSSTGGTDYYVAQFYNDLRADDDITIEISETNPGPLYHSRIQNRSTNSNDYRFSTESTAINFSESQDSTKMDKFTLQELQ
tara:strand:+ start:60 stop:554 length:495 start_codon:yes stop_codon:yes gene_type:complete